jgi:16S rRNA U516 pseudouridylate synthase RsuA-like enzyme
MLSAAGLHVRRLERTAVGPVQLTGLARGRWRELDRDELRALRAAARPKGSARQESGQERP